ncbi:MAG: D-alanine--D-alanine ligase [Nitrospirota bacterium]|nr:D-alanine--D-alanine ligase [Nitrospirota bacterium]MDE3224186.1 D-alanine--D-alanine ligase [Nitrospirota bacterium]MDE3242737.1 D-alanine--D-alanine ligase [Nitrospirota bacterium]
MTKKPLTKARIGVLMGGQSSEREVSLRTGQAAHRALLRLGYDAVAIDVTGSLVQQLRAKRVGLVFLALHGPGGEDGTIQGLLESIGMPYTGSGVRASAIGMHKVATKALLAYAGIPVAEGTVIRSDQGRSAGLPAGLHLPLVVKPASEGSTIGVSIVRRRSDWRPALRRAHAYDDEALVEAYIPGREIGVSVLGHAGKTVALPAVEIVAPGGFYDYAAKYTKGRTQYLCPAPLEPDLARLLKDLAVRTYRTIGCDGAARVDFRVTQRGKPYVLEINTIPGMTETSLLPMAAARAGLNYDALTEFILRSALDRAAGRIGARQAQPPVRALAGGRRTS